MSSVCELKAVVCSISIEGVHAAYFRRDVAPAGDIEAWIGGTRSSLDTDSGGEGVNSPDALPRFSHGAGLSAPGSSPNICMPAGLKLAFSSRSSRQPAAVSTCTAQCSQESAASKQVSPALGRQTAVSDDDLIAGVDIGSLLLDASLPGPAASSAGRPSVADLKELFEFEQDIKASSALVATRFVLRGLPVSRSQLAPGCALVWLMCSAQDAALQGLPGVQPITPSLCTLPLVLSAGWDVPAWSLRRACMHVIFASAPGAGSTKPVYHAEFGDALHLDSNFGLLVVFPEKLLSPSALTGGMDCSRRPLLKTRLPGTVQAPAALMGTLKHDLFEVLVKNAADQAPDTASVQDVLMCLAADAADLAVSLSRAPTALLAAEACGLTQEKLHTSLEACIPSVLSFIERHVFGSGGGASGPWRLRQVLQTEEEVQCAALGLKGVVDMVGVIQTSDGTLACVPLELKTGAVPKVMRPEHRAQVALYSLLLASSKATMQQSSTLDSESVLFSPNLCSSACGVLLHVRSDSAAFQVDMVPHSWQEVRSLMQLRNQMAGTFHPLFPDLNEFGVPERDTPQSVCDMCFERDSCGKLQGLEAARQASQLGPETVPIRWKNAYEYVRHFWGLVQLEQEAVQRRSGEGGAARHGARAQHPLLSDDECKLSIQSVLQIDTEVFSVVLQVSGAVPCAVRAGEMAQLFAAERPNGSMLRGKVQASCDGIIHFHTATDPRQSLLLGRSLVNPGACASLQPSKSGVSWRLQRQAFSTGTRIAHGALVDVHERGGALMDALCGKTAPSFTGCGAEGQDGEAPWLQGLNPEQLQAVQKCMQADDIAIIQGMPGAGKSTTTTALCLGLLQQGRRVLIASHTNAAVDGLLGKLATQQDFQQYSGIRLGQNSKVDASMHAYCRGGSKAASSVATARWVAGTAHTACSSHTGSFDAVVIDEASQLTEPATLALALLGGVVVLVGDHMQIAPLVHSEQARAKGLGVSMMQRLAQLWPHCLTKLCTQYRMTKGLQQVSNLFVYGGEMRCGLERLAGAATPGAAAIRVAPGEQTSFEHAMTSTFDEVVFVDVPEEVGGASGGRAAATARLHECPLGAAALVHGVCQLLAAGYQAHDIAVICALRKHVSFYERVFPAELKLRLGTIDTFQGQEAQCVLVDGFESKASLLLDLRRLNVACTRAKQKFVLFCHSSSLWKGPLGAVQAEAQRWILPLPRPFFARESDICEAILNGGVPQRTAWARLFPQTGLRALFEEPDAKHSRRV